MHTNAGMAEFRSVQVKTAWPILKSDLSGSGHFPCITVHRYCSIEDHQTTSKQNSTSTTLCLIKRANFGKL